MAELFTVAEIAALTGGRLLQGSPATPVSGFAYDSRKVTHGDCFVAMPGEQVDGHRFVAQAAQGGAACLLVGRSLELPEGIAVVQVTDPLLALGQLGRIWRNKFAIPVVSITGSVGKTTTKELVAATLAHRRKVFRTPGNLNSEVGLPVSIMNLTDQHQVAVLELGMRALGEISYLVSIGQPTIGIVTNVGASHLELLGTQANIALAKSELIKGLPPSGAAILNADDPLVAAMADAAPCKVWFYGFAAQGRGPHWVTLKDLRREGESGQRFTVITPAGEAEAYLPVPGSHNALNALAAVAAALELGLSLAEAVAGLADYVASGNRMRILSLGGVRIIDDSYNAAPASVIPALGVMRELAGPEGRCVAVLGSMFELGEATEAGHRQVGAVARRLADVVLAVGDLAIYIAEEVGDKARHFRERAPAIAALQSALAPGDTVLVKGSRGMALEEVVTALEQFLSKKSWT